MHRLNMLLQRFATWKLFFTLTTIKSHSITNMFFYAPTRSIVTEGAMIHNSFMKNLNVSIQIMLEICFVIALIAFKFFTFMCRM